MVLKMHTIIIPRGLIFKFRWDKGYTDGRGKEGRTEGDKKEGRKEKRKGRCGRAQNLSIKYSIWGSGK